jgi:hypothetical protein
METAMRDLYDEEHHALERAPGRTISPSRRDRDRQRRDRLAPKRALHTGRSRAFDTWTGGTLGVLNAQMEDFSKFTNAWFPQDEIRRR